MFSVWDWLLSTQRKQFKSYSELFRKQYLHMSKESMSKGSCAVFMALCM